MKNLICGRKPVFGDREQIRYLQEQERRHEFLSKAIDTKLQIEWGFCIASGNTHSDGTPKFKRCDQKFADSVVFRYNCVKCRSYETLLVHFNPVCNWYDELITIDESVEQFSCRSCGQIYVTDEDRYIYTIPNQES